MIVTEVGFFLPYAIWILSGVFASLPRELEESARVDGCTRMQAFWRILLLLSAPGLASCAVTMFILSWKGAGDPADHPNPPGGDDRSGDPGRTGR